MIVLRRNVLSHFLITFILIALMTLTIVSERQRKLNIQVVLLFVLNAAFWLLLLIREIKRTAYSLKIMNWFFCLFFFSLAPIVQYYKDWFPWIVTRSDDILCRANKLLLLWSVSVIIGIKLENYRQTHKKDHYKRQVGQWISWKGYGRLLPVLTVFNGINTVIRIVMIGASNLISRGTNIGITYFKYGSLSMLLSQFIGGIVYFTVAISILQYRYQKKKRINNYIILVINSVCLLISYFPTGLARYAAAVIYLGLMLTYFKDFKNNRYFILIFILAFTILLPFMNAFRNVRFLDVNIIKVFQDTINNIISGWKALDYDAYTYFTLTIEYVDRHGPGGHHLLSDLFFWVPRKIWPSKAMSGSYEIAHELGLFDNVSFPYPSIGYMDGGMIGMVLFGVFIGWIMECMDSYYWRHIDRNNKIVHTFDIMYPVIVIFWFFLYRGDIFYTLAYLVGYLLAWCFIVWLSGVKRFVVLKG
jgi:hypothetical protein